MNKSIQPRLTFKYFVKTKYLAYSKPNKTEKTFKVHARELEIIMRDFGFGRLRLCDITTEHIDIFKMESLASGLAKKTVNNRLALVGPVLKMAYKYGLIKRLPEIKLLKLDILPPRALDAETVEKLLKAGFKSDRLVYDFTLFFLHSGLRLSELVHLRWEDIDLPQRLIIVRKAKSHKFRAIPMNKILYKHICWLKRCSRNSVYVFEHEGQSYHANSFDRRYRAVVRKAGITATIHGLRHTFASRLVQRGVNLYEVQKLLGHSTITMTERYAHLRMDNLAKAVKVLE
jgi:integrase